MRRFPVPLPPINEQRRILAKIDELFSELDAGVAALERVRVNLKRYRAAILKAAVSGKLSSEWREWHPDTEPASVLLERILAERRRKWEEDQLAKFAEAGKQPPKGRLLGFKESIPPEECRFTEITEGWEWTSVAVADEVHPGRQRSPKHHHGSHLRPYLRVANFYEDRLNFSDVKQLNFIPDEYEIYELKFGDILLNEG